MKTHASLAGLGNQSEQSTTRKPGLPRIDISRRRLNRALDTGRLLHLLRRAAPRSFELAEVVGRWVWIQFDGIPSVETRKTLAQLGFHWNRARQAWQHPCGIHRDQRVSFDPRSKFGSYFAADIMHA